MEGFLQAPAPCPSRPHLLGAVKIALPQDHLAHPSQTGGGARPEPCDSLHGTSGFSRNALNQGAVQGTADWAETHMAQPPQEERGHCQSVLGSQSAWSHGPEKLINLGSETAEPNLIAPSFPGLRGTRYEKGSQKPHFQHFHSRSFPKISCAHAEVITKSSVLV